jgi:hypothetical protein
MKDLFRRPAGLIWVQVALIALVVGAIAVGCSQSPETPVSPATEDQSVQLGLDDPGVQAVMAVQDRHTPDLLSVPGVVGTATGVNRDGRPVVKLYLQTEPGDMVLPRRVDGVPVVLQVTGPIEPLKGPPGGGGPPGQGNGADHQGIQDPPIQLGTSGGWRHDLANGYCCGGTLGSLITDGSHLYILSNWHVLYSDIVSGGNSRTAQPGDPVIQPGLIDVSCSAGSAQDVATLINGGGSLPGSGVDAGIAEVIPGMVASDGSILEIGTLSSSTAAASIGQAVKKSGRTTGLARSTVDGLNGAFSITYANECAGGTAFTESYTGQIVVQNRRCGFLDGGDSGSLMVEDVDTNPRAVGLLFAGSSICSRSAIAIANPIDDVLSYYGGGFSMVGN